MTDGLENSNVDNEAGERLRTREAEEEDEKRKEADEYWKGSNQREVDEYSGWSGSLEKGNSVQFLIIMVHQGISTC